MDDACEREEEKGRQEKKAEERRQKIVEGGVRVRESWDDLPGLSV